MGLICVIGGSKPRGRRTETTVNIKGGLVAPIGRKRRKKMVVFRWLSLLSAVVRETAPAAPLLFLPYVTGTKHKMKGKWLDQHEKGVTARRGKLPSGEPSASIGHRLHLIRKENKQKRSKDRSPMGSSSRRSRVFGVVLDGNKWRKRTNGSISEHRVFVVMLFDKRMVVAPLFGRKMISPVEGVITVDPRRRKKEG